MTKVEIYETMDGMALRAEGHAGYDHTGKDVVCAAVSMLMQAAAQALWEQGASVRSRESDGLYELEYRAQEPMKKAAYGSIFNVAVTGLRMLEEAYPAHVVVEKAR